MTEKSEDTQRLAYGPVPSRRLGQSLGINNIPPKVCTYSCVYCQVGRTTELKIDRRFFYEPRQLVQTVKEKVEKARAAGERIDYLTFVPDGEPTLDENLGSEIEALKALEIKIAVITNASLVSRPDVRDDLQKADWVSFKVDTVYEDTWRRLDRPHRALKLDAILDGMLEFARGHQGEVTTETMLISGMNDSPQEAEALADFLSRLAPRTAYIAIPTRPPAESWAEPPGEEALNAFYQHVSANLERTEYLIGYEGNAFASTGNAEEDLLSITAVHPMRREAVERLLARAEADWSVVEAMVSAGKLTASEYKGNTYFLRSLPRRSRTQTV